MKEILLAIGLAFIFVSYIQEKKVEYRYIDAYVEDKPPSEIFVSMFENADPWVNRLGTDQNIR